jgi:hypothetical protein
METDERILDTLRRMEWERAKGFLQSLLNTFYSKYPKGSPKHDNTYDLVADEIDKVIRNIDDLIC